MIIKPTYGYSNLCVTQGLTDNLRKIRESVSSFIELIHLPRLKEKTVTEPLHSLEQHSQRNKPGPTLADVKSWFYNDSGVRQIPVDELFHYDSQQMYTLKTLLGF